MERLLIRKVEPVYPEAARRANLQGVVVLDAIIAADGTVVNMHPSAADESDLRRHGRGALVALSPLPRAGRAAAVETTLTVEFHP